MAHPYHHAISTQKKHGGNVADYQAIHDWFDMSKEGLADVRHRNVLHHSLGIFLCERKFGITIPLSSGRLLPVRLIGEQHVFEDYGFIPSPIQSFHALRERPWMGRNLDRDHPAFHAEATVAEWGGSVSDYEPIHALLESSRTHIPDSRHRAMLHHSTGIKVMETIFGTTITNSDERRVPVRDILEAHVIRDLGVVPSLFEAFHSLPVQAWMTRGAQPLARELGRLVPAELRRGSVDRLDFPLDD